MYVLSVPQRIEVYRSNITYHLQQLNHATQKGDTLAAQYSGQQIEIYTTLIDRLEKNYGSSME